MASALGKRRLRQVIQLKLQWMETSSIDEKTRLMQEMEGLLDGTDNLTSSVHVLDFIVDASSDLKKRDRNFSTEEAIDFLLRCFVEGSVKGKGTPLEDEERALYVERLDSEVFTCFHTGRRLQFFRSTMPDQASPDRLIFMGTGVLGYTHPDQITVRSSLWANLFFGDVRNRDKLLNDMSRIYLQDGLLNFDNVFRQMDQLTMMFLTTSPDRRRFLNQGAVCLVPHRRTQRLVNRRRNEFGSTEELKDLYRAFQSKCVVSGLNGGEFHVSLDRKIDLTGRYNWTDVNPMHLFINRAKSSFKFAFATSRDLELWFAEHIDEYYLMVNETLDAYVMKDADENDIERAHREIIETWVVVIEMRKYFQALLVFYKNQGNPHYYETFGRI